MKTKNSIELLLHSWKPRPASREIKSRIFKSRQTPSLFQLATAQQAWLSPVIVATMLVIMGITPMLPTWSVKTETGVMDAAKAISSPDAQLASHCLHENQEINMITAIFEWTNTPHFPSSKGFFLLQQTNNLGN